MRAWTTGDVRRLKRMREAGASYAECAEALGRSVSAAQQAAKKHGLCRRRPPRPEGHAARVLALHAAGHSARAIGGATGCNREAVAAFLKGRGLAPNRHAGEAGRRLMREAYARAAREKGGWMPQDFGAERQAEECRRRGWPEADRTSQADLLDLLLARGPMTEQELAAALGLTVNVKPWRPLGQCNAVYQRLRYLRMTGAVVAGRGPGKTRPVNVYRLADWLLSRKKEAP